MAREFNFDGLVGPTHHYAGLAFGNLASFKHAGKTSNPREAALQGLAKMHALMQRGFKQALLPPLSVPNFAFLRGLGFSGSEAKMLSDAQREAPALLSCAWSAASMWTANAATVSPSADCNDQRVHFTAANLCSKLHRAFEHAQTTRILREIFHDVRHFVVHEALPACAALADEGAANHTRFCTEYGNAGVEMFVYGRSEYDTQCSAPTRYMARQTIEASQAVARCHGLDKSACVFIQQAPAVIDQGVFHNDVIAVGNCNLLFYHEKAFVDEDSAIMALRTALDSKGISLEAIKVSQQELSVADAVSSYLFNSQILSRDDGTMVLVAPLECQKNPTVVAYLEKLLALGTSLIEVLYFDVQQSMQNGGGPACLRLRVVLNETEESALHQGVILSEALYVRLVEWVKIHYRDRLSVSDLVDLALVREVQAALSELEQILDLPGLYSVM